MWIGTTCPRCIYRTDEYPFEAVLTKSEHQLTRLIVTPPIPRPRDTERFTVPSDIWVVKSFREVLPVGERRIVDQLAVIRLYEPAERGAYRAGEV